MPAKRYSDPPLNLLTPAGRRQSTNSAGSFVFTSRVPGARDTRRDRALLAALASGSPQALAELYERHVHPLFRHALVLTRNRSDAEDLVQVVFLKLAEAGAGLLGVRKPAAYLHRILHTTWIDGVRRSAVGERVTCRANQGAPEWVDPQHRLAEDWIDAARALEGLPPAQREAVLLHAVEGFSFREIGRLTGVSIFTAAGRYRVGIARLRDVLNRRWEDQT